MNLVRSELLKIRTTNTWWVFALISLPLWGLTALINWLQTDALASGNFGDVPADQADQVAAVQSVDSLAANIYTNGQFFGLLIVMLLGIIVVTSEFFHQTVTTTFLTVPHRTAVMTAKLVAAAVLAMLFWLVTTGLNLVLGVLVLNSVDLGSQLGNGAVWTATALNALAYLLWSVLGVGIGVLIRSQIGATVTGILLYLGGSIGAAIAISILAARWGEWINNLQVLVPSLASSLMVSGTEIPGNPPRWAGAAVLIGYAVVTGMIGTLTMRRRDIS
ncbi:ABC transporter permease [Micromonospora carbonacea]|uniref:ABC transporter permease n=1 Tax=Micromonospora carbonacea TaxID=47853 RepID=A0A1C4UTE0_9ACTN|nr:MULTISPECIES: ABC transporter permease [Micromonospora]MBB5824537.1 ABC-type transport system involved in multi-copper enzyme maturation permease subunit [Micromonospora carbonacea]QLD27275.1 ABC transporter permease [Micromonospora carbonacea]WFE57816.1 ABC transporter permease [Micromonospora sp. WMMD712]SCE74911.1 ABC-2 family transporter protein [Micromonospora carbonacea]